jgi:hypothetical protein
MQPDRKAFEQRLRQSLKQAKVYVSRFEKANTRMLVLGTVSSSAAALVTGLTAAAGPVVGEGIPGWRLACIVGAGLAFASSVFVGLNQQLRISDRLSMGNQCVGRLRFLDLAVDTGSRDWDEITKEYESIVTTYPQVL